MRVSKSTDLLEVRTRLSHIEEKIREIMLSEELPDSEKLDRLHALIQPEAFKIDNLKQATPAQLRQLKDGLAITEAMQQIRRRQTLNDL
jgi:hypothetical protein